MGVVDLEGGREGERERGKEGGREKEKEGRKQGKEREGRERGKEEEEQYTMIITERDKPPDHPSLPLLLPHTSVPGMPVV